MTVFKKCKYCGAEYTNGSNDPESMKDYCGMCEKSIRAELDSIAEGIMQLPEHERTIALLTEAQLIKSMPARREVLHNA